MIVFKNWFIETRLKSEYQAPELAVKLLNGQVYGHPSFPDGSIIHSSPIAGIEDMGDHKDIITRSGSRYSVFPEDVLPAAEETYPGYYKRLTLVEGNNGK